MNGEKRINIDLNAARLVLAAVGTVALIVMAVALIVTPLNRFTVVSWVALAVGILGLAGFVLIDPESIKRALARRSGQYGLITVLMSLFFVVFIVALFIIIRSANITPLDVTENSQYTISAETVNVLQSLDEPVHVIAFFAEGSTMRDTAELWLRQYGQNANGKLTYEFADPEADPALAQQYEVTRTNTTVFIQGDRTAQSTTLSERELTSALTRVLLGGRRILYTVTGHGERSTDDFSETGFSEIAQQLGVANFEIQPLNLLEAGSVSEDADLVLVAGPTAQFAASEIAALQAYLDAGGALLLLLDPGTGSTTLGNGVLGVDFNSDGSRAATAGADGTIRIWDAETGAEQLVLSGHTSDVVDVAFSPDGSRLVSAGRDNTVRVWDAESGEQIATLAGPTEALWRVAWSPNGRLIASVGENQALNVWDASTYEPTSYSPVAITTPLMALAFSPDSRLIAATGGSGGSAGAPITVWDAATGEMVISQQIHTTTVISMAFSADGETLHTAGVDGSEGVLNLASGEGSTTARYPDFGLTALAAGPDGITAFGLTDGSVHVRLTPDAPAADDLILSGHTDVIWDIAVSADGRRLASASRDGSTIVWDAATGEEITRFARHSSSDPLLTYLSDAWGISVNDDVVVDMLTASEFGELVPVVYTYDTESPITQNLLNSNLRTFFVQARSLTPLDGFTGTVYIRPLLFSSVLQNSITSWGETTNPFTTYPELDAADTPGPVIVGASAERSDTGARLIIIGDSDFASNGYLSYTSYGNADLMVGAANWLAEGEDSIPLPSANFDIRQLDRPFSTGGLLLVIISLTCLLPLSVLVTGAGIWIMRRRRR